MKRTWRDIDGIAEDLAREYPDVDPLGVSLPDLRVLIVKMPLFGDDPDAATESILEAIQAAWYDEFED